MAATSLISAIALLIAVVTAITATIAFDTIDGYNGTLENGLSVK